MPRSMRSSADRPQFRAISVAFDDHGETVPKRGVTRNNHRAPLPRLEDAPRAKAASRWRPAAPKALLKLTKCQNSAPSNPCRRHKRPDLPLQDLKTKAERSRITAQNKVSVMTTFGQERSGQGDCGDYPRNLSWTYPNAALAGGWLGATRQHGRSLQRGAILHSARAAFGYVATSPIW